MDASEAWWFRWRWMCVPRRGYPACDMPTEQSKTVQPHPMFTEHYRDVPEKRAWLARIFDETAGDYDKVESWLALGSGRWYRRQALRRAGLAAGMKVVDVACGTGLVAREAIGIVGDRNKVIGVDPSEGMLRRASRELSIAVTNGRAELIPAVDESFDFLSFGYALRHVDDLAEAFSEFHRVLKPGGRLCMLEITSPRSRVGRVLMEGYMKAIAGVLCRVGGCSARTSELWKYYWETIDRCVQPEAVLEALRAAGFTQVERGVQLGVFSEYRGVKA